MAGVPLSNSPLSRLVIRQIAELMLNGAHAWQSALAQDGLGAFILQIVLIASIAHEPARHAVTGEWIGVEAAEQRARPVNGTAIAASMGFAHTTVRRRAQSLIDDGLLIRRATGYVVAEQVFASGRLMPAAISDTSALFHVLSVLREAGYAPARRALQAGVESLPPRVVIRHSLAWTLRTLEDFSKAHDDFNGGVIFAAIIAANVRHITETPALALRYSQEDQRPPDSERRPVPLRALARQVNIPFETVRRRVAAMVAKGEVVQTTHGVFVPVRALQSEALDRNNRLSVRYFEQMIDLLIALAVPAA